MTGPEHYAEAESLIALASTAATYDEHDNVALILANAQVHATLALAAATALGVADGVHVPETNAARDWRKALLP